jgi:hypothetical protein
MLHQKVAYLLDSIDNHWDDLPPDVASGAADLHAALAGPGPDALDLRPNALEVVNDAGLHAKAVAEAKARLQASVAAQQSVIAKLPDATLQAAADYDARTMAHRAAVLQSWDDAVEMERVMQASWWAHATLWAVLRRWWAAR